MQNSEIQAWLWFHLWFCFVFFRWVCLWKFHHTGTKEYPARFKWISMCATANERGASTNVSRTCPQTVKNCLLSPLIYMSSSFQSADRINPEVILKSFFSSRNCGKVCFLVKSISIKFVLFHTCSGSSGRAVTGWGPVCECYYSNPDWLPGEI